MSVELAQLRLARGRVRCGHCVKSFHALDYLAERPEEAAGYSPPAVSVQATDAGSEEDFQRAELPMLTAPGREASSTARPVQRTGGEPQDRARLRPEPARAAGSAKSAPHPMPAVLRDDLESRAAARKASRRAVSFGFASIVLLLVLGGQYAWFMPGDLLARFPQTRAWLAPFCEHTGCVLPQELDPGGVELITRDVRIHPDFEGALLVNATLMNALPFAQPYPRIQFILYNYAGESIAERTFEPLEYLQGSADLTHGMLPKVPVQAVLELLAAEQAAVSFEFRFL